MKTNLITAFFLTASMTVVLSCKEDRPALTSTNPSVYLTDPAKIEMVHSLKVLDKDRLLEMDYTVDYDLDGVLASNMDSFQKLQEFMTTRLLDIVPEQTQGAAPEAGCSAFAAEDRDTGDRYMGRNYDFCHVVNGEEVPLTAIMVKTAPKNGKKSMNMIDSFWMGFPKGFYNDGKTDLSMLAGAPYSVLDGMNEDGFAMGVLHLLGNPTAQADPEKPTLWCNVLIRYLLDRAGSVDEAIELARNFNINMENPASGNNHFFLADASGNYAILEYSYCDKAPVTEKSVPNRMLVLKGQEYSYVTNFYVDPYMKDDDFMGGKSAKGMARYLILKGTLWLNVYKLSYDQARDLLKAVSQTANPQENTSHTQWSALYNLSKKSMDVSILQEFDRKYSFSIE